MERIILGVLSDEHAGSKLALCNPKTQFWIEKPVEHDDGSLRMEVVEWKPTMTPIMDAVWDRYLKGIDKILALADGDPIYLFKLGEVCEGTYYKNSSMMLKKDYQVEIAVANMAPWLGVNNLKSIRIVPGDRSHEFDEGSAARLVAGRLGAMFGDVKVVGHGRWGDHSGCD